MIEASEVGVVLLAAGRSSRFEGGGKLLAPFRGEPLIARSARLLARFDTGSRVAVCDDASGPVAALLGQFGFRIAVNPEPGRGLSSSLTIGIGCVEGAKAALVLLADMPAVSAAHLHRLLAKFDELSAPIVASVNEGIASPPALIARSLFPRLLALQGDRGARDIIAGAALVEAGPGELRDIDRVEDLRRAEAIDPDACPE